MGSRIRRAAVTGVNQVLGRAGLKLDRLREHDWSDPSTFIPFDETIKGAARSGMPVGKYIDATYNVPGVNEVTVKQIQALGALHGDIARVLELGPGSGRYLEQVRDICRPEQYEIYETAAPWARWLVQTYGVTLRPTDGSSLSSTPTASVDLTHAHKVLVCLPFLHTCRYLMEMIRVTRDGGYVVFDAHTEDCLPVTTLQAWVDSDIGNQPYPSFIGRTVVLDMFAEHGFELLGTFRVPMLPGETEYFVFRKSG